MQYQPWTEESQSWQSWSKPWGYHAHKSRWHDDAGDAAEYSGDDQATTVALIAMLLHAGGQRPASAVGFLYGSSHSCPHRKAIRARGGVSGFVAAHPEIFALESAMPGEKCPTLRLRTQEEQWAWAQHGMQQKQQATTAATKAPLCRYHQMGQCNKGNDCPFDHGSPPAPAPVVQSPKHVLSCREAIIRKQVLFYLSDDNLRKDTYFQNILAESEDGWISMGSILKCPRMQQMSATTREVLSALRGASEVAVRELSGQEAVMRNSPLPAQDSSPSSPQQDAKRVFIPEASLEVIPLKLLRDCVGSWDIVIQDAPRRSWCSQRKNTWSEATLQAELQLLRTGVDWQVLRSRKESTVTRSTAWFTREGCCCRYVYGDVSMEAKERPKWLEEIEERVLGEGCGLPREAWPDSVNMNLYENDAQNVGWHSDDENLFGGNVNDCRIISASWGVPRCFEVALKDRDHPSGRPSVYLNTMTSIKLCSGDLCSMEGLFQKHYSHQLAKGTTEESPPSNIRVNLTWRYIVQHKPYCPLAHK